MLQKSTLLLFLSLLFSGFLSAQMCTPDTSFHTPGIYPANLPDGCVDGMYDAVITVVVPQDTLVNIPPFGSTTVPIDSIVLISVNNLHPGLSYQCGRPSCGFPGNTSGCIRLSGTPTVSGTRTLRIITDVHVTLPIVGAQAIRDSTFSIQFTVGDVPAVTTTLVDATCGMATGSATVNATGTGPFNFSWNTGLMVIGSTSTLANIASGNYSVNIEGANGCSIDTTLTINDTGGAVVDSTQKVNVSCNGANDGSVTVFLSGGTAPYSYNWSNMDTTQTASNLAPGSHTVTITDAANCVTTFSTSISQPVALDVILGMKTDVKCFGDMDGTATVTGTGGTTPLTFSWSNGATGSSVSTLAAGMHSVYVTDDNGCVDSLNLSISQPSQLTSTAGAVNSIMGLTTGRAWVDVMGGTPPYAYFWSTGASSDTISNVGPGSYDVTITDANGCIQLDTAVVGEDPNGIEEDLAAGISSWEVFPNPTSEDVQIRMELDKMQSIHIDLFDMNGRLIERQSAHAQSWQGSFRLQDLAAGLYLLRVSTSQGGSTRRIVKN